MERLKKMMLLIISVLCLLGMSGCGGTQEAPITPHVEEEPQFELKLIQSEIISSGKTGETAKYSYSGDGHHVYIEKDCEEIVYDSHLISGKLLVTETYDSHNNKISEYADLDGKFLCATMSVYDEAGNCISSIKVDNGKSYSRYSYRYDSEGNLLNSEWYTKPDGDKETLHNKHQYSYDSKGNLTAESTWYDFLTLDTTCDNTLDENGRLVKVVRSNYEKEKMKTQFVYEYEYDEDGNITKKTETKVDKDNGYTSTWWYTYDDDGNLIKEELSSTTGVKNTTTYVYGQIQIG